VCCIPMATRILIADDHEMMRSMLRELINAHAGWQVCAEAKDGGEAVAQTKELHPDLIVIDLAMPVMDGMRAAREITKRDPGARVVMFTLHASPEVEEQAKRVGIRRVVSKARNGERLVIAIERVLRENCKSGDDDDPPAAELVEDAAPTREIRVRQEGVQSSTQRKMVAAATSTTKREVPGDADPRSPTSETPSSEVDGSGPSPRSSSNPN
jgi:DNA-binding NarL/FixJ family response regulator